MWAFVDNTQIQRKDRNCGVTVRRKEGKKQGRKKGKKQGRKKGMREGRTLQGFPFVLGLFFVCFPEKGLTVQIKKKTKTTDNKMNGHTFWNYNGHFKIP